MLLQDSAHTGYIAHGHSIQCDLACQCMCYLWYVRSKVHSHPMTVTALHDISSQRMLLTLAADQGMSYRCDAFQARLGIQGGSGAH